MRQRSPFANSLRGKYPRKLLLKFCYVVNFRLISNFELKIKRKLQIAISCFEMSNETCGAFVCE